MVRYAAQQLFSTPDKTAISRRTDIRTSFKNTHEVAAAIQGLRLVSSPAHTKHLTLPLLERLGWKLQKAYTYLEGVLQFQRAVPMRRFNGGVGRTAQVKEFGYTQGRWPVKSVRAILALLKNAEANADNKNMKTEDLVIKSIVVQQAPKNRRRTYRAHGRINPYNGNPCHVEVVLVTPPEVVPRNKDRDPLKGLSRVRLARKRTLLLQQGEKKDEE
ncbi:60S ribosomal protein L17 [Tulasnella sp. 403]|nr:60S ribosomal protein L17 [Tulasnella sp. 403]